MADSVQACLQHACSACWLTAQPIRGRSSAGGRAAILGYRGMFHIELSGVLVTKGAPTYGAAAYAVRPSLL
jgi:hypothetical protein